MSKYIALAVIGWTFLFYDPANYKVKQLQEASSFEYYKDCEVNRKELYSHMKRRFALDYNWWISPECHQIAKKKKELRTER